MPDAGGASPPGRPTLPGSSVSERVRLLRESLQLDAWIAFHGVVINDLAGSVLVPRVVRYAIYRVMGLDVRSPNIFPGVRFAQRGVSIGTGTFINSRVHFEDVAPISIGEDCQIGMEALFVTSHHSVTAAGISKVPEPRPIVVGDGCWVGARAMVLPGTTIGRGCIIAAGAVVTRDCEPFGVYAGIPARRVKDLDAS